MAQLEATQARQRPRGRLPRRFPPLAVVALLAALLPLSLLAANPFNDLVPGSVHNANIDAIYAAGITTGCDPNVSYCPTDLVTRQEMASFLARTAGLGTNPPVANAKTAQTAVSAQTADTATNATNATNAANATNATNAQNAVTAQTAANANTVGGFAPNGLVRVARAAVPSGTAIVVTADYPPLEAGTPEPASAYQAVLTLPITAPTAGFIHVTAATSASRSGGGTGNLALFARLRLASDTGGTTASPRQITYVPASGAPIQSLAVTWVLPVGAGEQTIVLDAARFAFGGATGTISAFDPTLTAIFVPFGHTGGTALGEGGAATGEPGGPASGTR